MDKFWEDSRNGLPPLTGGGTSFEGGVREEGHGGRLHVQGANEKTGLLQGLWRVDGGRIPDQSSNDSTWEGGRDTTEMENPGSGGRAADFPNDISGKGRPVELTSGGMPGPSGDEDGNAGALPEPECPRQHVHYGGGNPPHTHSAPDVTCWYPGRP